MGYFESYLEDYRKSCGKLLYGKDYRKSCGKLLYGILWLLCDVCDNGVQNSLIPRPLKQPGNEAKMKLVMKSHGVQVLPAAETDKHVFEVEVCSSQWLCG